MRKSSLGAFFAAVLLIVGSPLILSLNANAAYDLLDDRLISVPASTADTGSLIVIVKEGLRTVPKHIKQSLADAGYKILVVPMIEDIENPQTHPRGYAEDRGWKNVAGTFRERTRQIIIAERVCRRSDVPVFNKHADETIRHEIGHAYDQYLGYSLQKRKNISAAPIFESAYNKDSNSLTEQQHQEFHYFLQSGSAGRKELFAELFATFFSGRTKDTKRARRGMSLIRSFPTSAQLVKDLINDHNLERFYTP